MPAPVHVDANQIQMTPPPESTTPPESPAPIHDEN